MKAVKNKLKTLLVFAILIPFFSFTKSERPSDSIKIVKRDNVTYMYLAQNINFSLNKVTINENCKSQLHLVIHYLKKYPKLEIEIGVHNDLRTKEDLTQTRASVLKGFLENYGANSNNIKAVGYSNNDLLNDCRGKDNKCSEKEQQANRRVEIKIINPDILEDYVVINNIAGAIVVVSDDSEEEAKEEGEKETTVVKEDDKSEEKSISKEEITKEVIEEKVVIKEENKSEKLAVAKEETIEEVIEAKKEEKVIVNENTKLEKMTVAKKEKEEVIEEK